MAAPIYSIDVEPRRALRRHQPLRERAFVGRSADLDLVEHLVTQGAPLVTITGTAGIGKTALAARFAAELRERARGEDKRIGFCDLSEARDAAGVRAAVARALRMPDAEGADEAETAALMARALIALGPAVLVLDNFEHVVQHAGATVGTWLAETPELQLVVTSRERLRIPGEIVHELAPLSLPQGDELEGSKAVELWIARVRELCPTYAVSPSDAPVVSRLVRELDGLPLAIELAAARFGTLTPPELLERLEKHLDIPGLRGRSDSGHRSTLRGAIDWSWGLLEPWERAAFAQCAVFRGRITIAAAEAVLSVHGAETGRDAIEVIEIIQALRDKSLLIFARHEARHEARHDDAESEPALSMYVSVRKYARDKLATLPEAAATFERHARYFLAYAEQCAALARTDPATASRQLLAERENLMAVVRRALAARAPQDLEAALRILMALEEPRWHHGSPSAHLSWLDEALAHPCAGDVAPLVRARALITRGRVAWRAGRLSTGESDLAEAVAIGVRTGDASLESLGRRFLALMLLLRGRTDESQAAAEHALRLALEVKDRGLEGMANAMLGFIARQRGQAARARRLDEQALDQFCEVGDTAFELTMRIELMYVHLDSGELDAARAYAAQALAQNTALGLPPTARLLLGLGHAALEAADPAEALARYREARDAAVTVGEHVLEVLATVCIAIALFEQGRALEARLSLRDTLRSMRQFGRHVTGLVTALLGAVEVALDHLEEARELFASIEDEGDLGGAADSPLRAGVELCRGFFDFAQARRARADGDSAAAAELEGHARRRLEAVSASAGAAASGQLAEMRILARLLGGALTSDPPPLPTIRSAPRALRIDADGRWFEPPSGPRVACASRPVMRRMLLALARARLASAHPVTAEDLIEAGWPGERILPDAARNRLHVMVSRMRDLGLREVLLGSDLGYFLAPDLSIELR